MRALLIPLIACIALQAIPTVSADDQTLMANAADAAAVHVSYRSKENVRAMGSSYGFYRHDICLYATTLTGGERASFTLLAKANIPIKLEAVSTEDDSEMILVLYSRQGQAIDLGTGDPPSIDLKVARDTYLQVEVVRKGDSQKSVGCSVAVLTPHGYLGERNKLQVAVALLRAEQVGMAKTFNVSTERVDAMCPVTGWLMIGCVLAKSESFKLADIKTGDRVTQAAIRCDNRMAQVTAKLYTGHDGKLLRKSDDPLAPFLGWWGDANYNYSVQVSNAGAETLVFLGLMGVSTDLVPNDSSDDAETEKPAKAL